LRLRVLLFDWWVMNGDRTDENSNLLWVAHKKALHVIDHNLSFDSNLTPEEFWQSHIFRSDRDQIRALEATTKPLMVDIIGAIPTVWRELPDEWLETENFDINNTTQVLGRCMSSAFWELE
jgi:hypothetical protein